jgi:hypothetical protein
VEGDDGRDSGTRGEEGERGGVVNGDDRCDVRGDNGGGVSRLGGLTLRDLVRGASVGVRDFCNSEGEYECCGFAMETKAIKKNLCS